MSDLIINIRVGLYHFQVTEKYRIKILKNIVHKGYPNGFFWVYEFFGWTQTKNGFVKNK
jgi:hypothetical protein